MERIELSKRSKNILFALKASQYPASIPTEDVNDIIVLIEEGLIKATPLINNQYCAASLTQKGKAYLHCNPRLKNPSIWDDKKYWITTSISVMAIIISIVALYQSY